MKVLVINCGSSSIKYQLYEMPGDQVLAKGNVEKIGEEASMLTHEARGQKTKRQERVPDHDKGMELVLACLTDKAIGVIGSVSEIGAVGHRVVHGGERFSGSVVITPEVVQVVEEYADLAPLHNPPNLTGIRAAMKRLPGTPQVAAFDTAFHQTIPRKAFLYALPYELYERYRIRRYGFHGTSHRYVARRAAQLLGMAKDEANLITAHLGNGCSITAVERGKSVDTSMGLTPLEGLVMGTRCGDIDPAIIFYLAERRGMAIEKINALLNKQSGLLGVSGLSNDMRNLRHEDAAWDAKTRERARVARDIFAYRLKKYLGAYLAVLGRVHGIVFTGGIGENDPGIRWLACENLGGLGIQLDPVRNDAPAPAERLISADDSPVKVFVIPTNEEARIAFDTYELTKVGP
ncbi:MAG: acetate kinase [Planctomycetes bacterium]|nr:acetate kinase [Planctomycetota bacterium]